MLRTVMITLGLCGLLWTATAADDDKKPERQRRVLTEEQKAFRKQIIDKYDANKDGRLDADERKAITAEDREKMRKIFARDQEKKPEEK